jgi:hypothetical protein
MAVVRIDSGKLEASDRFCDTPKDKWPVLVLEKKYFLSRRINYDCRCLVEFCEEAEVVWKDLGYESAADMIRNGFDLDPVEVELAVAWLKHNEPEVEIGLTELSAKIAEARAKPLAEHGGDRKSEDQGCNTTLKTRGTVDYTLKRLARDAPELLDAIERRELTVNQAAIKAGFRRKPSPEEACIKAFNKCESKLVVAQKIIKHLDAHEREVVRDWLEEKQ